ncbi:tetratricopeptide repeat protein [candidate division WOR-3 bacterium]|nr:tetratricopeptide repeat protein [candidate division WOR-3 bacterium]
MAKIGKEYIDDLTGLYNRRYLNKQVPKRLKETQRSDIPLSIVLIDLDHFKNVNDTYGHARGDVVLKEFGMFLKTLLRKDDTVFRYGGDEFICILPNAEYEKAVRISQRFMERCRIKEFAQNRLTLSIGVASSPENAKDWRGLFEVADRNLYSAKRHGRDQIGIFEEEKRGLNIPTVEIVGRDEEIVKAKGFIKPIFGGSGGAVCISGEIGVGKTRFVREIVRDSDFRDVQFVSSNLSATTKSIPYYPFRDVLRTIIYREGRESIRQIPRAYQIELIKIIPELSDKSKEIDKHIFMVDKFRLFEGVRRLLSLQCIKGPLFVCLDNIHWADDGSLELFHYLVRALKESPIFFFLIYRVEEIKGSSFQDVLQLMGREGLYEEINIEPLETADVARMLSLIIDAIPPHELTDYIYKETGGNPFFIEELMKSLETNSAINWDGEEWVFDRSKGVVIPYSVEGVVERKLGMIDSEANDLIEYAAVIGREFDFAFLRDITKMNEGHLFDLMDEILEVRLLKESGGERYCFSEDIIRGIIYRQIGGAKLRRYHRAVGERLLSLYEGRTEEVIEELSHHFYLSGDRDRAVEYSMIAADKAKDVYANSDAIRFYTWAIEYLPESKIDGKETKVVECLRNRANVLNLIGGNEKAVADLKEAINKAKEIGNKEEEADCLTALCKVYQDTGQYNEASRKVKIALKIYRELNDRKGETKSLNKIGSNYWYLGEYPKALEFYQSSLKIVEEMGDRKGIASSLNNIGIVYYALGKYSKALEYSQGSLKIREEIGARKVEAVSLNNIGAIHKDLGEYSKALEFYHRSLKIDEEIGNRNGIARCLNNIGGVYYGLGEYSRALEFYHRSLKIDEEIGDRHGIAMCLNNIGGVYYAFSEYSKALEFFQGSLKIQEEIGDRKNEATCLTNIGRIYEVFGEYSKALEFFRDSLKIQEEIGDRTGEAASLIKTCDVFIDTDDFSAAERYCNKAYSVAQEIKSNPLLADTLLSRTSLYLKKNKLVEAKRGIKRILSISDKLDSKEIKAEALSLSGRLYTKQKKWDKAKSSFKESISIFEEIKNRFELAKIYYYQGIMFKESGDKANAKIHFTKAMEIFKKLGAKAWIKKLKGEISHNQKPTIRKQKK